MKFIKIKKISSKDAWKLRWIVLGFIVLAILSLKFSPLEILHNAYPQFFLFKDKETSCVMLNLFNIPCPFCGMSRAFYEIMNLNFSDSIYYNPFSVIFFTFLAILTLSIFTLSLFNYKILINFNRKTLFFSVMILLIMWTLNIFFGHH